MQYNSVNFRKAFNKRKANNDGSKLLLKAEIAVVLLYCIFEFIAVTQREWSAGCCAKISGQHTD